MVANKRPKKSGSIYQRADGMWCASVELPMHGNTRRRKLVTTAGKYADGHDKDETVIRRELDAKIIKIRVQLEKEGDLATSSRTVAKFMDDWFTNTALKKIRPRTAAGYRSMIQNYIIPSIGRVRIDKLTDAHVTKMHDYITDQGLSSTTALQTHRVLSVALKHAVKIGAVPRNVAAIADAPRKARGNPGVLTAADAKRVLRTVYGDPAEGIEPDRLASRWAAALFTGARQGELLGLELDRVSDVLDLSWQLQRVSWEHGCGTEAKDGSWPCGRKRGTDCEARKVTMPADWEWRPLTGGLVLSRPKSNAGWRLVPLVDPLRTIIEQRLQAVENEPNPYGLLWTANQKQSKGYGRVLLPLDGSPIDPAKDNHAWHDILVRAGIESVDDKGNIVKTIRLHDARHTTASLLLEAGVPEPIIMKILGHSSYVVTRAYQNVSRDQLDKAMSDMSALMSLDTPTLAIGTTTPR
jgi:integrase